jgi:hypothetical protein
VWRRPRPARRRERARAGVQIESQPVRSLQRPPQAVHHVNGNATEVCQWEERLSRAADHVVQGPPGTGGSDAVGRRPALQTGTSERR